jgi:hypothetical protein
MKNIFYKLIFATLLILVTISCSKDFLEESPTQVINEADWAASGAKDPAILAGTLNGIYYLTFDTGTGGTTDHTDFGQKGYDIYSDMLCGDMALSVNTYGWYGDFTQYQNTTDYTDNDNYKPWRYYYRIIRSTNLLIKVLGGNDAVPEGENAYNFAQAKAMRAYSYFYLTQYFIKEYKPASKVLPIYTDPDVPNQPQSETSEVYDLMISDLTQAITLLDGFDRSAKYQINQDVAKALLAYVYASMNTSATNLLAKDLAEDVIGNFPLTSYDEATGGFNTVNTPSWMWGVDISVDQGLDLVSWWGQMDIFTYSYAWAGDAKAIDQNLYNSIGANDVRKSQFYPWGGYYYLMPWKKFFNDGRDIGGQRTVTDDYLYMRVDEMYLLSAEMSAKEGIDVDAHNRIKDLLSKRFENATDYAYIDGLSGQNLIDEVYLQTRIELWGEGKSYLAMKRNKATINRGDNHLSFVGVAVPYNDDRLTWEIPQSEIQNNPFIN